MSVPKPVLIVDLSRRLPDINRQEKIPSFLEHYGRCAILRSGSYWFAHVNSSHPGTTQEGFYWGLAGNVLYLSPRGAAYQWEKFITKDFVQYVADKIGVGRRYREIVLKDH